MLQALTAAEVGFSKKQTDKFMMEFLAYLSSIAAVP
jgi:hypothetical protein